MSDPQNALQAIDDAIKAHHREVYRDDEPTTVVGWVLSYTAVDGNGRDVVNYAAGQGTPLALAVGLLDLAKTTLTGLAVDPGEDDEL